MKLAQGAFGTPLVATVLIILQIAAQAARLADPRLA